MSRLGIRLLCSLAVVVVMVVGMFLTSSFTQGFCGSKTAGMLKGDDPIARIREGHSLVTEDLPQRE